MEDYSSKQRIMGQCARFFRVIIDYIHTATVPNHRLARGTCSAGRTAINVSLSALLHSPPYRWAGRPRGPSQDRLRSSGRPVRGFWKVFSTPRDPNDLAACCVSKKNAPERRRGASWCSRRRSPKSRAEFVGHAGACGSPSSFAVPLDPLGGT